MQGGGIATACNPAAERGDPAGEVSDGLEAHRAEEDGDWARALLPPKVPRKLPPVLPPTLVLVVVPRACEELLGGGRGSGKKGTWLSNL
mmetsp:Transcript_22982/g.35996  ORF Transcript_22982/g.35996 Transcript_22982/m.35996 type:complete len:89 (-) Transcript_22982:942-1208(-)